MTLILNVWNHKSWIRGGSKSCCAKRHMQRFPSVLIWSTGVLCSPSQLDIWSTLNSIQDNPGTNRLIWWVIQQCASCSTSRGMWYLATAPALCSRTSPPKPTVTLVIISESKQVYTMTLLLIWFEQGAMRLLWSKVAPVLPVWARMYPDGSLGPKRLHQCIWVLWMRHGHQADRGVFFSILTYALAVRYKKGVQYLVSRFEWRRE